MQASTLRPAMRHTRGPSGRSLIFVIHMMCGSSLYLMAAQRRASASIRHSPATSNGDAMSKLKMEFYDAALGVEFSVTWKDEEEFRRAKAFLTELAGPSAGRATP